MKTASTSEKKSIVQASFWKRTKAFWTSLLVLLSSLLFVNYYHPTADHLFVKFVDSYTSLVQTIKRQYPKSSITSNNMATANENWENAKSVFDFKAKDIDGNEIDLSKYRGQVLLIVNVACKCGFTAGNYPQLQELHQKYKSQGFSLLAFPCNQFGGQEPGSENDIKEFVQQFGVDFDLFSKIKVNGDDAHPMYKYLKKMQGGTLISAIKWNFSKFLINRQGIPVNRYAPTTPPKDIEDEIVKLLKEPVPKM